MGGLLDTILQLLGSLGDVLLGLLMTYWPILAAIAAVMAAACWGLSRLTKLYARWRNADGFWSVQPRYLFNALSALLANKIIREMYEPSDQNLTDLEPGQKPGRKIAWLHAYPQAIKSTIKFNRSKTRGGKKRLDASRQICELCEWIEVMDLPDFVLFAGAKEEHFVVSLRYNGEKTQAEMEALSKIIEKVLSAQSVELLHTKNTSAISFTVHLTEPENPLVDHGKDHTWLDENPSTTPKSLPVAITGDGTQAWNFPTHHTVCLAMTGGGKASVMHSMIRQYGRFVVDGSVVLHGADGKKWEMRPYAKVPGLFPEGQVAFETEQVAEMIFNLKDMMEQRARDMDVDLVNMKAGTTVSASREHPWHILIIDELWDILDEMGLKHPAYQALNSIARKGRALGFFIIAFTQTVELSEIGNLRKNFVNKIAGRQDSDGFNDYMLGKDAAARGFDTTAIPESNEANGNKYAGMFFVKGESGEPQLVRFAYNHGDEVLRYTVEIQKQIEAKRGGKTAQESIAPDELDHFPDEGGFGFSKNDEEEVPELEVLSIDDFDEPLPGMI